MNTNELLEQIRTSWKQLMSNEEVKLSESTTVTTKDGKTMMVQGAELGLGLDVVMVQEDGTQTPVEDGSYELTDGTTVTIVGSKVDSISMPSPEQMSQVEIETSPEMETPEPTTESTPNADVENLKKEVEDLKNQMADLISMVTGSMESQVKMKEDLKKIVEIKPALTSSTTVEKQLMNESKSTQSDKQRILELRDRLFK